MDATDSRDVSTSKLRKNLFCLLPEFIEVQQPSLLGKGVV